MKAIDILTFQKKIKIMYLLVISNHLISMAHDHIPGRSMLNHKDIVSFTNPSDHNIDLDPLMNCDMFIVNKKTYPKTVAYIQNILQIYPHKVSKILFVIEFDNALHSYKTTLMIPYGWVSLLEKGDKQIDEIIKNYITRHMNSSFSKNVYYNTISKMIITGTVIATLVTLYKLNKGLKEAKSEMKKYKKIICSNIFFQAVAVIDKKVKFFHKKMKDFTNYCSKDFDYLWYL